MDADIRKIIVQGILQRPDGRFRGRTHRAQLLGGALLFIDVAGFQLADEILDRRRFIRAGEGAHAGEKTNQADNFAHEFPIPYRSK